MVRLLLVLLVSLCSIGCSRLQSFTQPAPSDLIRHSWWFDGRQVSVCGTVKHSTVSCTLEVCPDDSNACSRPTPVWLSAERHCYVGEMPKLTAAVVQGRFLDLHDAPKVDGAHDYVLAGADVTFVRSCRQELSWLAPSNSFKPSLLRGAA